VLFNPLLLIHAKRHTPSQNKEMKKNLTIIALLFINWTIQAQITDTLNEQASPKGGVNKLAVKFFGIDFSKEQRLILEDKEIEFIFEIPEASGFMAELGVSYRMTLKEIEEYKLKEYVVMYNQKRAIL